MRVKRSSNTVILAFFSIWIFSLTNTVLGEDATPKSNCEIIQEALYSEFPAKQILLLKKRKINLNQLCDYPWGGSFEAFPPLVYAVRTLEFPTIKALVESGSDANLADNLGVTPIMVARDLATVQFLLKSKAKVNWQDSNGWTPLMWQTTSRETEAARIVEELIRAGAKLGIKNKEGKTAIELANDQELKEILLRHQNNTAK